jgi:hypothetical protein
MAFNIVADVLIMEAFYELFFDGFFGVSLG